MIIDSSALVAVVLREPMHLQLLEVLDGAPYAGIGAPTVSELGIVLSARLGVDARRTVNGLLEELDIETVSFTNAHGRMAIKAFWRYGRGRHRAGLNFGDCMTYAVAAVADEPLLFVGDDFTHTDLPGALQAPRANEFD